MQNKAIFLLKLETIVQIKLGQVKTDEQFIPFGNFWR